MILELGSGRVGYRGPNADIDQVCNQHIHTGGQRYRSSSRGHTSVHRCRFPFFLCMFHRGPVDIKFI